jgi:hypothetical protein
MEFKMQQFHLRMSRFDTLGHDLSHLTGGYLTIGDRAIIADPSTDISSVPCILHQVSQQNNHPRRLSA